MQRVANLIWLVEILFNIQLTEDGSTDSYISIGIIVDLTFTEVGETIKIPVGNIIYEGPENRVKVVVKNRKLLSHFKGLPATYTCTHGDSDIAGLQDVHILAPNGIKHLNVTISGEIAAMLGGVGLPKTFDICNMDDGLKEKIIGLGLVTGEEYIQLHAGTCTKFIFKLRGLFSFDSKGGNIWKQYVQFGSFRWSKY